jgi:hypothetical protein
VSTLALPLGFDIETRDAQRAYQSSAADGAVLRRRVSERKLRRWRLNWPVAPRGVYELVREAWDENGAVLAMDWTDPDGNAVRVRFAERPDLSLSTYMHASIALELEEVL